MERDRTEGMLYIYILVHGRHKYIVLKMNVRDILQSSSFPNIHATLVGQLDYHEKSVGDRCKTRDTSSQR